MRFVTSYIRPFALSLFMILMSLPLLAQVDQGAVTGVIKDSTGATIPGATVTLTDTDNGLVLTGKSDASGIYTFSPVKIGNYKITATHPGFATVTQENVTVDVQQRRAVDITLSTGAVTEIVDVTAAPPLLQSEEASTGQVIDAKTIDQTPLNGRNWVYIAQLTAGVAPPNGSRGAGKGDFNANGQRAEQNNFILDGIDNNTNVVDFLGGASYVIKPPPDALAEFKVQTGSYSSEFGHSAGAALNASIKSGSNRIHGSLWEYIRNDAFDIKEYFNPNVSKYRQNQFGATLGFPIIKNKLFFFGDTEANRIIFAANHTGLTVPTALMRQGNFSELLNPTFSGTPKGIQLYQPGSGGLTQIQGNALLPTQINPTALKILNLYPLPNINNGVFANNYQTTTNDTDNTFQYDTRVDYNASAHDLAFARWSYTHEPGNRPGQLGPVLDGGGFGDTGQIVNLGEQFAFSETHIFNSHLTNEARFGYTYGHFAQLQQNINTNVAAGLGLGGIPFGPLNGGLPNVAISGITSFGSPTFYVSNEYQNNYQILDNITKVVGNHTIHAGVNFQHIRFSTEQPTQSRGSYSYTGLYTSNPAAPNTGFGVADFLTDNQHNGAISNLFNTDDVRWNRAAYVQDDWRASDSLTINAGLRYEYAEPYVERHDHQAAWIPTQEGVGTGVATYNIPASQQTVATLPPVFTNLLTANNIQLVYTPNRSIIQSAHLDFAPRIGIAYRTGTKGVVRAGYGIFFGGLESAGYYPNLGENFPFEFDSNFNPVGNATNSGANCLPGNCPTDGITLATGFTNAINQGLINSIATPSLRGSDARVRTPYSQQYNLSVEYSVTPKMVATLAYVGSNGRHLIIFPDPNSPATLANPTVNTQNLRPFPGFGGSAFTDYEGASNYNSLQAKLEKSLSKGLSFLGTYTFAHSLDDAPTPLGSTGDSGYRGTNVLPINYDYSNSPFDVRHRVTVNGNWEIPVGKGRGYMSNAPKPVDYLIGGWSLSLVFRAQTGEPFTVGTANYTGAGGASAHAIRVANPFATNLTPPANAGTSVCPTKVRTSTNWYNPCAFANPALSGANVPVGAVVRGAAALPFLGDPRNNWYGPGYERIDMSLFKSFATFREQSFQLRADAFNVLNTPSFGLPATADDSANGGRITGSRTFQNFTPDSRFFQFSGRYFF